MSAPIPSSPGPLPLSTHIDVDTDAAAAQPQAMPSIPLLSPTPAPWTQETAHESLPLTRGCPGSNNYRSAKTAAATTRILASPSGSPGTVSRKMGVGSSMGSREGRAGSGATELLISHNDHGQANDTADQRFIEATARERNGTLTSVAAAIVRRVAFSPSKPERDREIPADRRPNVFALAAEDTEGHHSMAATALAGTIVATERPSEANPGRLVLLIPDEPIQEFVDKDHLNAFLAQRFGNGRPFRIDYTPLTENAFDYQVRNHPDPSSDVTPIWRSGAPDATESHRQMEQTVQLDHFDHAQRMFIDWSNQQSDFSSFTTRALHDRIQRLSPGAPAPDAIFVNTYRYDEEGRRVQTSSKTLLQIQKEAIAGREALTFDFGKTGFYSSPSAIEDEEQIPSLRSARQKYNVEKALNETTKQFDSAYWKHIDHFWSPERRIALASETKKLRRDEARLRDEDGTLDPLSARMVAAATSMSDPQHEVSFSTISIPGFADNREFELANEWRGALVLSQRPMDQPDPGKIVLLRPGQAIQSFDSKKELEDNLTISRPNQNYSRFRYTPIQTDPFGVQVNDWLGGLHDKLHRALDRARRAYSIEHDTTAFGDRIDEATDIGPMLDVTTVLSERNRLILETSLPDWIKHAKSDDLSEWRALKKQYEDVRIRQQADPQLSPDRYGYKDQLLQFTRTRLTQQIRNLYGIDRDPDKTFLTLYVATGRPNPDDVRKPGVSSAWPRDELKPITKSLTELSLSNISWFVRGVALERARVTDAAGHPDPVLTPASIKSLVREADIGKSYAAFLREKLLHSPEGHAFEDQYVALNDASMRLDLQEASMAGDLHPAHPLYGQRGKQWVKAVLASPDPATRSTVEGHNITVSSVQFDGVQLHGLKIFGVEDPRSVPTVVAYTPDAPDGIRFREYPSQDQLWQHLTRTAQMRDYLISRAPVAFQDTLSKTFKDLSQLKKPLRPWTMPAAYTPDNRPLRISEKIKAEVISDDFWTDSYKKDVEYSFSNVDAQTTSTSEQNTQDIITGLHIGLNLVEPFLPLPIQIAIGGARLLSNIRSGIQLAKDGQYEESAHAYVEALHSLVDVGLNLHALRGYKNPSKLPRPIDPPRRAATWTRQQLGHPRVVSPPRIVTLSNTSSTNPNPDIRIAQATTAPMPSLELRRYRANIDRAQLTTLPGSDKLQGPLGHNYVVISEGLYPTRKYLGRDVIFDARNDRFDMLPIQRSHGTWELSPRAPDLLPSEGGAWRQFYPEWVETMNAIPSLKGLGDIRQNRYVNYLLSARPGPSFSHQRVTEFLARLKESVKAAGRTSRNDSRTNAAALAAANPSARVPDGFKDRSEFAAFGNALYQGLKQSGYPDAKATFQGSSVTGESFKRGEVFDFGRTSDFDIALSDPTLFRRSMDAGVEIRERGIRTAPLKEPYLSMLGLSDLSKKLSNDYGREVHFMVYADPSIIDKLSETGMKIGVRVPGRTLSWTLH